MALGLKANNLLVFLSFLRGLVRLRAPLELLADSRNSWGLGRGGKGQKKVELMGLGLKATVQLGFSVLLQGLS